VAAANAQASLIYKWIQSIYEQYKDDPKYKLQEEDNKEKEKEKDKKGTNEKAGQKPVENNKEKGVKSGENALLEPLKHKMGIEVLGLANPP
jgi:hypothetical protein